MLQVMLNSKACTGESPTGDVGLRVLQRVFSQRFLVLALSLQCIHEGFVIDAKVRSGRRVPWLKQKHSI